MNKFKKLLDLLGLSYKKEMTKITLINVISLIVIGVLTYLFKQMTILLIGLALLIFINYFLFNSYSNKKKKILNDRENEFITMVGYFQIFISNNYNVYQSLSALRPYASSWMNEQIQTLIEQIDRDKSVKPFIDFANKFTSSIASNVMLSIYQMIDEGESNLHMMQFNALFEQLSQTYQEGLIEEKNKSMSSISAYPLVGAGAVTILLTFGIIAIMGEMINVL